ncbi:FAD-binding protein [Marinobacter sp.]|uniref:FAD-binding protein n=1 Tax=Marinobacter sp. TaxID=50741 RepID=UPI002B483627|nr:FAD-binding protein [Marinobacter sp.]HKK57805.1 FAD-binding protein [Marinobacter sp.]
MYDFISKADNNYSGLDRGFNQRFSLDEKVYGAGQGVYLVYSETDVLEALENINSYGLNPGDVRMISGGHCYENFTFQKSDGNENYTKYVIDLSNMQQIYVDTINGIEYIVIEPGASNWLMQSALHSRFGATLPGGSCYSVCAGGHLSGGGYGLLSRLHGLTVDYLSGVEIVVPNSDGPNAFKLRPFDPDDEDSLNWASRGGGAGHYGVITKYFFRKDKLPRAPERAKFIALPVPWSQFMDSEGIMNFSSFMKAYFDACASLAPQAFTLGKFTCMADPNDMMSILIQVVYGESSGHSGEISGGDSYLSLNESQADNEIANFANALSTWIAPPTKSLFAGRKYILPGHPVSGVINLDSVYDLPWIEMTQLLNGSGENQKGKYKSSSMIGNFDDAEAEAMFKFLTDQNASNPAPRAADKSQTLIQIDSYGAQVNALDDGNGSRTAIAARSSILKLQYQTYWKETASSDPNVDDEEIISWFNEGYSEVHRNAMSNPSPFPLWGQKYQGCYFNYPDRHIGVNPGYEGDPGESYRGAFAELYFGQIVADKLMEIKSRVDPANIFSFAQSIPVGSSEPRN